MVLSKLFAPVPSMEADQTLDFIRKNKKGSYTVLDVRTPPEQAEGHIAGAKLVPLAQLKNRLDEIDRDKPIIVYCRTGFRSRKAVKLFMAQGFEQVHNLSGGLMAWQGPLEKG